MKLVFDDPDMGYIYLTDSERKGLGVTSYSIPVKVKGNVAFVMDMNEDNRLVGIELLDSTYVSKEIRPDVEPMEDCLGQRGDVPADFLLKSDVPELVDYVKEYLLKKHAMLDKYEVQFAVVPFYTTRPKFPNKDKEEVTSQSPSLAGSSGQVLTSNVHAAYGVEWTDLNGHH